MAVNVDWRRVANYVIRAVYCHRDAISMGTANSSYLEHHFTSLDTEDPTPISSRAMKETRKAPVVTITATSALGICSRGYVRLITEVLLSSSGEWC